MSGSGSAGGGSIVDAAAHGLQVREEPCGAGHRPDPTAPDYGCFVKELRVVRLVEFQGSFARRGRLSALKSTTLITKAKRIPLVDLTPCVIDLTQEE